MNHKNDTPPSSTPGDAELEAQIVAWVAGEASPFMIAALESAVATRPELAVFKRRIEAVHGLVSVAARPDREPLRLSPERRAKLLQMIDVAEPAAATPKNPAAPAKPSVLMMPGARKRSQPFWTKDWFYSAAACLAISVIGMWIINSSESRYERPRQDLADLASSIHIPAELVGDESETELSEPISTASVSYFAMADKSVAPPSNTARWSVPRAAAAAPKSNSMDALSARGEADTTDEGATGVLSPFEVTAEADRGYTATYTLAGTRIATRLQDIGSSISVVTGQTLQDTGTKGAKQRDNFLSKSKSQKPAAKLASKSSAVRAPAPAAPAAMEDDVVVLSPFEVTKSPGFLKKTTRSAGEKRTNRPAPSQTTAGMESGTSDGAMAVKQEKSDESDQPVITIDEPLPRPAPPPPPSIEEVSAAQEAVSTFSLHVSDVSFKLALAALDSGNWPDRATIRPEEFYNAFDYGDPATAASEKISCRIEQSAHPFAQQRNLVRIAMRVPATGRGAGQPLHLTVLLDTSGSMERPDRRAAVRSALATLIGLLGPADRLTLIGFARQPRLLAEALDGNHANQALDHLDRTPAEGGTNLEEALKLGSELARRHFLATAQNRIVLLTDGAANLGNADPDRLSAAVESLRAQRIAFDACGVGLDGLDDTILEALTRKGDGRYYVLNSPDSADAGFARQLAGALRPAAENVKVQVRFNPSRVGRYRLVGFEKHRLREEDFRNDAVDAAELAAEEAAVAVYEIEAKPSGEGELGEVFVRFRDAATKEMVERSWTLPYEARAAAFDRASPSIQLAGTAAMLAEKIRGGPAGDRVELDALAPIVNALRGRRPDDQRLQELATMFEQLRRLEGK